MRALLALAIVTAFTATPAFADKRIALVIGNSAYRKVAPLATPAHDAAVVAAMLKSAGFDSVETGLDLTRDGMSRAMLNFNEKSRDADVAVIYYAGHASYVEGSNFLIPVDATLARQQHALYEATSLKELMSIVQSARKLGLVLLDACREYPFFKSTKALSASCLARVEPPANVIVSFAAKEGSVVVDGVGPNSSYARALIAHLAMPGVNIRTVFEQIRDDVLRATANVQEPALFGSLTGEFYLAGPN